MTDLETTTKAAGTTSPGLLADGGGGGEKPPLPNYPYQPPVITIKMLRGACPQQRQIFRLEWPQGAEATLENVRRAQELGLDLEWGARWFTNTSRWTFYEALTKAMKARSVAIMAALTAFEAATAPAKKVGDEAVARAKRGHYEAVAKALKAYTKAIAPAKETYAEAINAARKAYDDAVAVAWLAAFLESQGRPE